MWVGSVGDSGANGSVTKLRASDGLNQGSFAVGRLPTALAFDGANIWVANFQDDTVSKLRASDGANIGTYRTGSFPVDVLFDGTYIWIPSYTGGTITRLLAADGSNRGVFDAGPLPGGIAFDGAYIWIANQFSAQVTRLRASDGSHQGTFAAPGSPRNLVFDGANMWVTNGSGDTVTKLRASDGVALGTFPAAPTPLGLMFDGTSIWISGGDGSVAKIRPSDGARLATIQVGIGARGLAFDGSNIWVTVIEANSIFKIPALALAPLAVSHVGSFLQGQPVALYSISVYNSGSGPGAGSVTVTDTLPAGLAATAISGAGWNCNLGTVSCSRSDSLAPGDGYPAISVSVSVASDAPLQVGNQVSLSGGLGETNVTDTTAVQPPFSDVSPSDSFLPAIDLLKEHAITSACQSQPPKYCPNDNITEAQMAVFVVRSVIGSDDFTYTTAPYFTDVPASNLYFPWIQKMQDLGIALPCAPNRYCPDTPVTRGIMAVLIIRGRYAVATPSNYPATPLFTDAGPNHPYFPWIQKMGQLGITTGCTATTYCPDDSVTRGQMAVFLMRGGFNLLLPANIPVVDGVFPATASRGQTTTVTITGKNTNFSGATQVDAGAGITVGNIIVTSATTLTAQFVVAPGATPGPRSITLTSGTEEATLPNGFRIQ